MFLFSISELVLAELRAYILAAELLKYYCYFLYIKVLFFEVVRNFADYRSTELLFEESSEYTVVRQSN